MTMIRYRPLNTEVDNPFRLFEDTFNQLFNTPEENRPWTPAVDILENEQEVVLKADLPEVDQKNIDVKLENGTLTLKGERKFEKAENGAGYRRIERAYGTFVRYFSVPETVEPEKVKAEYKNGVLTIRLPKKEVAKPKTIPVEVVAH